MSQNQEKINPRKLLQNLPDRGSAVQVGGIHGAAGAHLVYRLYQAHRLPVVVVAPSAKAADQFYEDLQFFFHGQDSPVIQYPAYHIVPFKFLSYHNETAAGRIALLFNLVESSAPMVVTTVEALLQKVIPKTALSQFSELLMVGEEIEPERLVHKLICGGYSRTAIVEEPGDYCVRGGIIDIFAPLYRDPLRIELYGDLVDSLRHFSAASQRSGQRLEEAIILPAKEAVLDPSQMDQILGRIRRQAARQELPVTRIRNIIQQIKTLEAGGLRDSILPLVYPKLDTFFDYTPEATLFILLEPAELHQSAQDMTRKLQGNFEEAVSAGSLAVAPEQLYLDGDTLMRQLEARKPLHFRMLPLSGDHGRGRPTTVDCPITLGDTLSVVAAIKSAVRSPHPLAPLVEWINGQKALQNTTVLACRSRHQAERIRSLLKSYGLKPQVLNQFPAIDQGRGQVYLLPAFLSTGFIWDHFALALITEAEVFSGTAKRRKALPQKVRTDLLAFEDLKQGDLVVHSDHGIGRYEGLVKLTLDGSVNDYLLIVYRDEDKLYLPVERMGMVQKYMGVDGVVPVLDKMGGRSWERVKQKVKRSTERIAGELLKLYASRRVYEGHSFSAVDAHFREFEAGFPYEETQDQQKAIETVLEDMRRPTPMDRLVCGDVGYGKTEVALRASFLAISEAKQVAVLVPTTVLAEQHFSTFQQRFERYPVKIARLSRFRSSKEQREIIGGLKSGQVDIVIGTHRLLQKDVAFKDLGLLILDEEQRFGVKHKERLKRLRNTVDVLALTATPIPRTLHLSLMGIRDISVISTPPDQRHAIHTYISEFDETIVKDAVRRELARGGQIFFVHNNILTIERMADRLRQLLPEIRIQVAHGRMDERELERVMLAFMNREVDMLVCTTIIESGLDISSANTILINRADRFGLAQIYQLRGRVGRADEQAYAYLFIPAESTVTKDAQKRLKVLMEHSDLGSGFQIAMSDLKIRGGGTLLGASQSGHIAAVGYDMFLQLMEESIAHIKGERVVQPLSPEIHLPISAFISEAYVTDIDQRLSIYRRLAKMSELKEIADMKSELGDRFGRLPEEAANLLLKIMLKILAEKAAVKRLDINSNMLLLQFSEQHLANPAGIAELVMARKKQMELTPDLVLRAYLTKSSHRRQLAQSKNILIDIAQHVNC
jgi:transcription-repair coupling factor (superfamily II helicase)